MLWVVTVLLIGLWSAWHSQVEWLPSIRSGRITIGAAWPGASPRDVERYVVAPLERALQGIPGTTSIRSYSAEGFAALDLESSGERGLEFYLAEVADRLAALRSALPSQVTPRIHQEAPAELEDDQDFLTLQLVGRISPETLRQLAEDVVAPRLRSLQGIAGVAIEGGQERELRVALDGEQMRTHHIVPAVVRQRLEEAVASRSFGWIQGQGGRALIWSQGEEEVSRLRRLPLGGDPAGRLVRLTDIAQVDLGPAPAHSFSRVDGKPVVTLRLQRTPGSHLLKLAEEVKKTVARMRRDLPAGLELLVADDRSEDLKRELRDLALRGGVGLLAVIAVLLAILRSGRAAGLVMLVAFAAFAAGLILLQPLGLTFNVLTFAGLGLLLGLLVDSGTVVVERLLREWSGRQDGQEAYRSAVVRALRAVWPPLLAGTLATIAVFVPMVYLSGEIRALFAPLAVLAGATLICALLTAVFVVPVLGRRLPAARGRSSGRPVSRRQVGRNLMMAPFRFASRFPAMALLALAFGIGLPTPLLPDRKEEPEEGWASPEQERSAARYNQLLGAEPVRRLRGWLNPLLGGVTRPFLEKVELGETWSFSERPQITVRVKLPSGSGIERADERIRSFEARALQARCVRRTLARVTEDGALLQILFQDRFLRTGEPLVLREALIAQALQMAGMEVSISGLVSTGFYSGLGDVSGFPVVAYGSSYERLEEIAEVFARHVAADPRVAGVDTSSSRQGNLSAREVVRLRWGAGAVERTGINATQIAASLRSQLVARTPLFYARLKAEPRIPVRLTAGAGGDTDLAGLLDHPVQMDGAAGGPVRLAGLAELSSAFEPPAIEREDQQYKRHLLVYYRGPYRMGKEWIEKEIQEASLPPGYRLEQPTQSLLAKETRRELLWLVLGTLALVYLVVAAVLESWRLAGLVMISIPLAWIGVALGFVWSGENFGEGAFLGALLIIGVAVNAGILLAYRFRQLRLARPGAPAARLALLAVRSRLRPMWATTLSAVAGMLPMLLMPGAKPFWIGLAITVVGGLLSSTLLAPVALVALLSRRPRPARQAEPVPRYEPNAQAAL